MKDVFEKVGMPLLEMRCPQCGNTQQMCTRNIQINPYLTQCCSCNQLLVGELRVKTKPNNVLFTMRFTPVTPAADEEEKV